MNLLDTFPLDASQQPIREFDALNEFIRKTPWHHYQWLQKSPERRIYKLPQESNFYLVHRLNDIQSVLGDPDAFSSQIFPDVEIPFFPMMSGSEHRRIRGAVQSLFSNRVIKSLEANIENNARRYTNRLPEHETIEMVDAWCSKIPLATIAEIFGYSDTSNSSLEALKEQALALNIEAFPLGGTGYRESLTTRFSFMDMLNYARALPYLMGIARNVGLKQFLLIRQYLQSGKESPDLPRQKATPDGEADRTRRIIVFLYTISTILKRQKANGSHDQDTVIQRFVQAEIDGEVSSIEVLTACLIILMAGYGTTASILSMALTLLSKEPRYLELLRQDPDYLPLFVDELFRTCAPLQRTVRRSTECTTLGGTSIPKDAQLILLLGAANHDENAYSNPYEFDPKRQCKAKNVTFGYGIHYCLGSFLAKGIVSSSLSSLVEQYTSVTSLDTPCSRHITQRDTGMFGFEELFVRLQKRESKNR